MSRASRILLLSLLMTPASALADAGRVDDARGAQVIVTDPNYDPNYNQNYDPNYQQQPQQQPVESGAREGRGFEYGGSLFVPIWLKGPSEFYSPGVGLDVRAGWELGGGLSIDGHLGFTYNGVRDRYAYTYDDSLQSIYLGVGLRYAILNPSALVPFVQAGLQLNLWSYCYYGGDACSSTFDTVNAGLYAGGGVLYEINPFVSIDFGLNFMMILGNNSGNIFEGFEKNLQPFIGVTLYY